MLHRSANGLAHYLKRRTQEIFRKPPASVDIIGGDRLLPDTQAEPTVGPAEELRCLLFADELFPERRLDEAMADYIVGNELVSSIVDDPPQR